MPLRTDGEDLAAQPLCKELEYTGYVPQRHPAGRLLDSFQRFAGLSRKVGACRLRADVQYLHATLDPYFKSPGFRGKKRTILHDDLDHFGLPAHIAQPSTGYLG